MRALSGYHRVRVFATLVAALAVSAAGVGCVGPGAGGSKTEGGLLVRTEVIGAVDQVLILPNEDTHEGPLFFIKDTYVKSASGEKRGFFLGPVGPERVIFRGQVGSQTDEVLPDWAGPLRGMTQIKISADGKRYGYLARKGEDWLVFVDGNQVARYRGAHHGDTDVPGVQGLQFSPDGAHFCYCVNTRDGNEYVVFDGRAEKAHPKMRYPGPCAITVVFSPDGNRHAYTAWTKADGGCVVVVDGVEGAVYSDIGHVYDGVGDAVFSPDSRHFGYVGVRDGNNHLVIDGKEVAHAEHISGPWFTREACRVVYSVPPGIGLSVEQFYLDGQPLPATRTVRRDRDMESSACDVIDLKSPLLNPADDAFASPDGRRYAYRDLDGNEESVRLVVDGEPGPWFKQISACCEKGGRFSPDSAHLAYMAERGDKSLVVLNGRLGPEFDAVCDTRFSSDSARLYYSAIRDGRYLLVSERLDVAPDAPDRRTTTEFPSKVKGLWFFLTRQGGHAGHIRTEDRPPGMAVFLDAELVGRYDWVGPYQPTADGVEFLAKKGGQWVKVSASAVTPSR